MTDPSDNGAAPGEFVQRFEVRYGDCDMQGIVFNANYLAYVDHTLDMWFRQVLGTNYLEFFEFMVKKVTVDWQSPARAYEVLEARPGVTRWGNTSFDLVVWMEVAGRKVARADLVYVSIEPGTHEPTPIPDRVRGRLGEPR
ncbi:MAG: acyl-CoA thioesterase [Pseudonocardiaceae bacterium]|nr:acyl-CoA thioesterase [Pseudonocardiaceae bacterium]